MNIKIPLSFGVIGTLLAHMLAVVERTNALVSQCTIQMEREIE
jgi:hypothetical protein